MRNVVFIIIFCSFLNHPKSVACVYCDNRLAPFGTVFLLLEIDLLLILKGFMKAPL